MPVGVENWNWLGRVKELNKTSDEEGEPDVHLCSQADRMLLAVVNDTWSHLECVCIDSVPDTGQVCGSGRLTAVHKRGPSNLLSPLLAETKAELEDLMADIKKLANKIRSKLKSEYESPVAFSSC